MGETVITWTPANWLTISIMGIVTFMLVGLVFGSARKVTAPQMEASA